MARTRLTPDEARRAALAAQGFGRPRPPQPGRRALGDVARRLGVVQIDSVNVLARAHYLPFFARVGPYDRTVLDAMVNRSPRTLFEYWGHEAALLPVSAYPLLRWRMERAHRDAWGGVRRVVAESPGLVDEVGEVIRERGPITVTGVEAELAHHVGERGTDWGWNWSNVKRAIAYLFWSGAITSAGRDTTFRRRYATFERVLPPAVLAAPTRSEGEAQRGLVRIAADALGVATAADLADYFRLSRAQAATAITSLVEAGELVEVTVPGWATAYARPDLRVPRRVAGSALLAPFDPLIWFRPRTERIFGMRYRIGIYTPAPKREHGYYVLPFLHEGHLVARVDLKADRAAGALLVQSAHGEPGAESAVGALALELRRMADWLELDHVVVVGAGDLAPRLTAATRSSFPE